MPGKIQGSNVKPLGELNPDFVVSVKYLVDEKGAPKENSDEKFAKLIRSLTNVGFYSQVRPGEDSTLLVFIKINDAILLKTLKSFHLKDYLYGVKNSIDDDEQILEHLSSAEKLRAAYSLISEPIFEGGAGITPGSGEWQFVEKIIPLYDVELTERLITQWGKKPLIDENDIATIKDIAGEKVALYFGFLRFYTIWLVIPSVLGFISNVFFRRYSIVFTVLNLFWAILMINAWKKKQNTYAISWNTKDSSFIESKRGEFVGETEEIDPVTGIKTPTFPDWKRTLRELGFLPVALGAALTLVAYQFGCFFIEIFLNEIYQGPGKQLLGLVPTVLIVGFIPILTAIYTNIANKFLKWENHETNTSFERSYTQKQFILNFLASYMPLFITSFVYLPFGHLVNPYLSFIQSHTNKYNITIQENRFQINKDRLNQQFAYFAVTAQIIGFVVENIVPIVLRKVAENSRGKKDENSAVALTDLPEEAAFLQEVRKQVALPAFNVNDEYKEMIVQFGYLAIFSPVWSLAPIVSLVNNWIEFRGDAFKLFSQTHRPIPVKTDSMAPWDSNMRLLLKVATLAAPAITVMFRQSDIMEESAGGYMHSPIKIPAWILLAIVLVSEHLSIGLNFLVEKFYSKIGNKTERDFTSNSYKTRRQYIDGYLQQRSPSDENEKRSFSVDPTEQYWENFSNEQVVKHASIIPKQVLDAIAFKNERDKKKLSNEKEVSNAQPLNDQASKSSYQAHFENNDSTLQSRSKPGPLAKGTTGAKVIHETARAAGQAYGAGTVAAAAVAGTIAGAVGYGEQQKDQYDAQLRESVPSSTSQKGTSTSLAATGALSNDAFTPKPSSSSTRSSSSTSKFSAPATTAAAGLSASNIAGTRKSGVPTDTNSTSSSSSKKGGFLSKFKKDAPSVSKGAKADFAKDSDQLKSVAADAKKGDHSSGKKLAGDVKSNPDQYIGNTKSGYQQSDLRKSGNTNTGSSAPSASASNAGVGTAGVAGTTAASAGHSPSTNGNDSQSSGGKHNYGTGAGAAVNHHNNKVKDREVSNTSSHPNDYATRSVSSKAFEAQDDSVNLYNAVPEDDSSSHTKSTGAGTSAAGATLPPNFQSKDAASSTSAKTSGVGYAGANYEPFANQPHQALNQFKTKGSTSQSTNGKTAATDAAIGAAADPTSSNTQKSQNNPKGVHQKVSNPFTDGDSERKTLDPNGTKDAHYDTTSQPKPSRTAAGSESHPTSTQGIDNQDQQNSNSSFGGTAANLASATGEAGLANKFGGSSGSETKEGALPSGNQKVSSNLADAGGNSYLDSAKSYAQQHDSQLNEYLQKAANKADDYAKTSDNKYVSQGNQYIQKLADKTDEYAKQQTAADQKGQTTAIKDPQDPSGSAGAAALNPSSVGKNSVTSDVGAHSDTPAAKTGLAGSNSEGDKDERAYNQFASKKHSGSEGIEEQSEALPQHFLHENKNPYTGQVGAVPGTENQVVGAATAAVASSPGRQSNNLQPPRLSGVESASNYSSTTPSPKKKKGFLSKIKQKVK